MQTTTCYHCRIGNHHRCAKQYTGRSGRRQVCVCSTCATR